MESQRHKRLKKYLQQYFSAQQWSAEQEVYWAEHPLRPDVMVNDQHSNRQSAFEIELSKTSYRALSQRQEKYRAAGLNVVWLLSRQPRQGKSSSELPFFVLGSEPKNGSAAEEIVAVDHRWLAIGDFLQALIDETLAWRPGQIDLRRSGYLLTSPGHCWTCQRSFTAIRGLQSPTCQCGKHLDYPENLNSDVLATVIEHSPIFKRLQPRFGPLARLRRQRTRLASEPYFANHCPHCRKLQGEFFLPPPSATESHPCGQVESLAVPEDVFTRRPPAEGAGHWCYTPGLIKGR